MSVLIKGMELPTGCKFCAMMRYYPSNGNVWCNATNRRMQYRDSVLSNRQEFCPLIEVPTPHGRLIDTDELYGAIVDKGQRNERGKYRIGDFWELNGCEIREVIDGQPTIIEAEE